MTWRRLIVLFAALVLCWPLGAQFRDDQFKRDAFSQTYADSTDKAKADSSQLFSFKEYFGGLAGRNKASLKTLTIGSAVLVGGNQIYNRQYWKLPIIYGGIGAGIYGGIRFNQLYKSTEETKFKTFSTLSFVGAGLFYWGSLMDGAVMFNDGGKKPNAAKATVYSILLPGLGQIYNGELWKVPIYWGLMAGATHFFLENRLQYQRWRDMYNLINDPEVSSSEKPPWSAETAKYYRDVYRRYRDYSVLAMAIAYVLQIVDANVFAYMQDFEVNDDISMRLAPTVLPTSEQYASAPAVGMRVGFTF